MKRIILIISFFSVVQTFAQNAGAVTGKKYVFRDIGWTIMLPADFMSFPSADSSIHIQPGRQADDQLVSKRLIVAMKDANSFDINLSSCDNQDERYNNHFSASAQQTYKNLAKGEGVQCDSATTTVLIDGVPFQKFQIVSRKNNLVQAKYIMYRSCYKGYSIWIRELCYGKKEGDELEAMLVHSTFRK